jgi:hypothetical protein
MWGIPPPLLSLCQGQKGGQSHLQSIVYKKHYTPLYVKKNSGKNLWKIEIYLLYMKRRIKLTESDLIKIVKHTIMESYEKELQNYFKKIINHVEKSVSLSFDDPKKIGSVTCVRSNQLLEQEYPNLKIEWSYESENDDYEETIYYFLIDENGNDILKYSTYIF